MPIEIRELIIRATVQPDREVEGDPGGATARARAEGAGPLTAHEFDRIVAACVKRLVRIMKRSDER